MNSSLMVRNAFFGRRGFRLSGRSVFAALLLGTFWFALGGTEAGAQSLVARRVGAPFLSNGGGPDVLGEVGGQLLFTGTKKLLREGNGESFIATEKVIYRTDGTAISSLLDEATTYRAVGRVGVTDDYLYFTNGGPKLLATDGETIQEVDLPFELKAGFSSLNRLFQVGDEHLLTGSEFVSYQAGNRGRLLALDGLSTRTLATYSRANISPNAQRPVDAGSLLFSADDVIYATDGDSLSPLPVIGGATTSLWQPVRFGTEVLFSAMRGGDVELYKSNGAVATQVADLNPLGDSSPSLSASGIFGDHLYFRATAADLRHHLFRTDGVSATQFTDLRDPDVIGVFGGRLFFSASNESGRDLFSTDGVQVTELNVVPDVEYAVIQSFAEINGRVVFATFLADYTGKVWSTDGLTAEPLADLFRGGGPSTLRFGDALYFGAYGPNGNDVFTTDGTTVSEVATPHPVDWIDDDPLEFAGRMLLRSGVEGQGSRVLAIAGSTAENIAMDLEGTFHVSDPIAFDGRAFFFSHAGEQGQLWEIVSVPEPGAEALFVAGLLLVTRLKAGRPFCGR
jgi:hypothetical protein